MFFRSTKVVAKSVAKHYSQQNTKTETGEPLNKKTKTKHHTKQNNKTINNTNATLTQHMNENAIHGAPKKGLRMENCTKQSLRMAPNSKVEDT